jgi:hypothetical protein
VFTGGKHYVVRRQATPALLVSSPRRLLQEGQPVLEAAAKKFAASTEQLRAKIRGLGGEPVSTDLVNSAISLDDHAILAECERKQHMAKMKNEREKRRGTT